MRPGTIAFTVLGLLAFESPSAKDSLVRPDTVIVRSAGKWHLVRKVYCSIGDCGKSESPIAVDLLEFDGDTIRGKGFQAITTPFGGHAWRSGGHLCVLKGMRWVSLNQVHMKPVWTSSQALECCKDELPPDRYPRFEKLVYHPSDSLTIWPWELRKCGDG